MNSVIIGSRVKSSSETAMSYALLIVEPAGQRQARSEAEGRALYERMVRFSEDLKSRGLLTMTQSLKTDTQGARVRVHGDRPTVVDGPFAEAKEMIGGFFILTCESSRPGDCARRGMPGGAMGHRGSAGTGPVLFLTAAPDGCRHG